METLLIFGGSGSLGHTLVNRYINTKKIVIFSRDENKHWNMRQTYKDHENIVWILGCIRDKNAVENAIFMYKPNEIIIASALKHIDQCENNIHECVSTNIIGIKNIIDIIFINAVKNVIPFLRTVLFVSTDKACSPVNAYGMCKSLSERIVIEKSQFINEPKFVVVRYGNVLNSRGSLLPLYHNIGNDDTKTTFGVTDKRMTRFFMTLDESVDLINNALLNGTTGDTFIPKIKSYNIYDIAKLFSKKYNKPISISGLRPGEKLFEVLVNITEVGRSIVFDDVIVIKPCYKNVVGNLYEEYTSDNSIGDIFTIETFMNNM